MLSIPNLFYVNTWRCIHLRRGVEVMFIEGARASLVCGVKKAKRAEGTLDLVTIEQELIRKQDRHICCGVEVHVGSCRCISFPPL